MGSSSVELSSDARVGAAEARSRVRETLGIARLGAPAVMIITHDST